MENLLDEPTTFPAAAAPLALRPFAPDDAAAVVAHVLAIQREEFGLPITASDQPDLLDVPGHYQHGAGGFWVAPSGAGVVGTVGLLDVGGGHGVLRKMFVAAAARGPNTGLAAALLTTVVDHARRAGLHTLWLGTTDAFTAAHRFYEKHGFERVPAAAWPGAFPRMAVDTRFYRRTIAQPAAAAC